MREKGARALLWNAEASSFSGAIFFISPAEVEKWGMMSNKSACANTRENENKQGREKSGEGFEKVAARISRTSHSAARPAAGAGKWEPEYLSFWAIFTAASSCFLDGFIISRDKIFLGVCVMLPLALHERGFDFLRAERAQRVKKPVEPPLWNDCVTQSGNSAFSKWEEQRALCFLISISHLVFLARGINLMEEHKHSFCVRALLESYLFMCFFIVDF